MNFKAFRKLPFLLPLIIGLGACNPLGIFYGTDQPKVDTDYHPGVKSPPRITSISPSSGAFSGGTLITITGSGFQAGATVTLGGDTCTSVTVVSATQITCTSSAHAISTVDVVVTNPDRQSGTLSNSYAFTSAVAPAAGSALSSGGGVTATGVGVSMRATVGEPVKGTKPQGTGAALIPGATGISFEP